MAEEGYVFEVVASEAEESNCIQSNLGELVAENARSKAQWVAERYPAAIVIGADTLVAIDGEALGKPRHMDEAVQMIERLSGRTHEVSTGVALCCVELNQSEKFHVVTRVTFKELKREQIASYFAKVNPLDKAGAYGAQEHGDEIIERIDGSWSNVVGLPMDELRVRYSAFLQGLEVIA
ncbi:MAG: Maf family protein, partial [Verrucomicrobia bacterium]|nr:Maf family protein [Verrucomicrobiota bacterium]